MTATSRTNTQITFENDLRMIQAASKTVQKRFEENWVIMSADARGQITTCLRIVVQILYAEGLEGKVRDTFLYCLVQRSFNFMNAIAANHYDGLPIAPIPYEKEYAIKVLKAIYVTAGILLHKQPQLKKSGVFPLHGLEVLTGWPWTIPLWNGNPIKVGGGESEEILGEVDHFDTAILRCIDSKVTINHQYPISLNIRSNWEVGTRFDMLLNLTQMPKELITLTISYFAPPTSSWVNRTYSELPYPCFYFQPSASTTTVVDYETALKRLVEIEGMKISLRVSSSWCDVAHVTLMHPIQKDMIVVMRKDRPMMRYPARRIQHAGNASNYTISSTGMECITVERKNNQFFVNGYKARIKNS